MYRYKERTWVVASVGYLDDGASAGSMTVCTLWECVEVLGRLSPRRVLCDPTRVAVDLSPAVAVVECACHILPALVA
jgi:hypothetical protein